MKEQLVSFETAKLAKEKGFHHMKSNCYGDNMCYQLPDGELTNALKGNTVSGYILAPTQSLLQKYLREEHNLHLVVDYFEPNKSFYFTLYGINKVEQIDESKSYEEALEQGLQEALKLLKQ